MDVQYIEGHVEEPTDGRTFGKRGQVSTRIEGDLVTKSADPFGSVRAAYECLEVWKQLGYSGYPSSPASFFREAFLQAKKEGRITSRVVASLNHLLAAHFDGMWIDANQTGALSGTWHHYDLNSAFLWAGLSGNLPARCVPYDGHERWVGVMDVRGSDRMLPAPMGWGRAVVTSRDVEFYGIEGDVKVAFGLSDWTVDLWEALRPLQELPEEAFKTVTQAYWGTFAMRRKVVGAKYEGGKQVKTWEIGNRVQNLAWAAIITHRIMRKVWSAAREQEAVVYVDSVLIPHELDTGTRIGAWKKEGTYPGGVFVAAPGQWTDMQVIRGYDSDPNGPTYGYLVTPEWTRHAGVSAGDPKWINARFVGNGARPPVPPIEAYSEGAPSQEV